MKIKSNLIYDSQFHIRWIEKRGECLRKCTNINLFLLEYFWDKLEIYDNRVLSSVCKEHLREKLAVITDDKK